MNLDSRIKFRHLQCFLEVARQGSVNKAATTLAITRKYKVSSRVHRNISRSEYFFFVYIHVPSCLVDGKQSNVLTRSQ